MKIGFNWGTGIAVTYAAFAVSTLGFVAFALGRPVDLVSADYYARSLAHDERMAAARGAGALDVRAALSADGENIVLTLPREQIASASGTVTLYRPSSAAEDRVVPLALDAAGTQRIAAAGLARGRWIVKIDWDAGGRRFHSEAAVRVP